MTLDCDDLGQAFLVIALLPRNCGAVEYYVFIFDLQFDVSLGGSQVCRLSATRQTRITRFGSHAH